MSKRDTWFGYLQAGEHSSAVVRDSSLETKNPKTIYLFNHVRGKFLEYSLEVVAPKLRDMQPDDVSLTELKKAYKAARREFVTDHAPVRRITTSAVMTKPAGADPGTGLLDGLNETLDDSYAEDDNDDVLITA